MWSLSYTNVGNVSIVYYIAASVKTVVGNHFLTSYCIYLRDYLLFKENDIGFTFMVDSLLFNVSNYRVS